ncbi:hypothetical protein GE21DRAFT_1105625 [Neurospora crassa]|nr:hypothetical protein GE21DRAFT_1105625 [Neurospora crassa]
MPDRLRIALINGQVVYWRARMRKNVSKRGDENRLTLSVTTCLLKISQGRMSKHHFVIYWIPANPLPAATLILWTGVMYRDGPTSALCGLSNYHNIDYEQVDTARVQDSDVKLSKYHKDDTHFHYLHT